MPSPVAFEEVATDEREIALFAQELCIGLAHRLDDFNSDLATIAANLVAQYGAQGPDMILD